VRDVGDAIETSRIEIRVRIGLPRAASDVARLCQTRRVSTIALIGAGRMGRTHARALARCELARLVAVCDPVPGAPEAAAPTGAAVYHDTADVLADSTIAGVLIAAPTPLHDELVEHALVAGKHVLCEKPLTLDVHRDHELGRLAESLGLVLQVGFWRRFAWPYREAARLLADDAIGSPRLMRLSQWDSEPPPPAFCDPAVSGGIEIDCGVHELDLAAWLLRSPLARVSAAGTPGDPAIEAVGDVEAVVALAVSAGGAPATIDLARSVRYGDDVRSEIVGAHGAMLISAIGRGSLHVGDGSGLSAHPVASDHVLDDALAAQADCFARAIGGQRDPALPGAAASAHALAAAQAMRRARLSGEVELIL
jgi:myo-inositol 2-dehydrogenase/D-chiro-inositol 1-dehydrogenase